MGQPLVSIVIPTYNEAADIADTLEACIAIKYPRKEIIVVDDSDDATPDIVASYADRGVELIHRERNEDGRSGARNAGILRARGELVVILNADVFPQPDFLDRLLPHYEKNADFVVVESEVANLGSLLPRFTEAFHRRSQMAVGDRVDWTEGFSCRREAALRVGMFPTPPIPLMAGEDNYFSRKLSETGYRKAVDRTICVTHRVPGDLRGYWSCMKIRTFPPTSYFLEHRPLWYLSLKAPAKSLRSLLRILLLAPMALEAWDLTRYSPRGRRDWLPFWLAAHVRELALTFGEWEGLALLWRQVLREGPTPYRAW